MSERNDRSEQPLEDLSEMKRKGAIGAGTRSDAPPDSIGRALLICIWTVQICNHSEPEIIIPIFIYSSAD
ncbi:hypothetical protein YC2023_079170 [Brassica napus]